MRPAQLERFGCGERCWRPEAPDASLGHSRGRHGCQCNELSPHARLRSCPRAGSRLYGAALQWWPALSRLCGARCSQTWCGATVAAVHSFETTHAHAGVARVRAFTRVQLCPTPCCPQRTLPHTRPARAALRRPRRRSDRRPVLSVVRRSLAQVLRLVAEGAVSASRSAARAPGAPVRSAVRSAARCGRRRRAIRTLVASGYRPAPETPAHTLGSK